MKALKYQLQDNSSRIGVGAKDRNSSITFESLLRQKKGLDLVTLVEQFDDSSIDFDVNFVTAGTNNYSNLTYPELISDEEQLAFVSQEVNRWVADVAISILTRKLMAVLETVIDKLTEKNEQAATSAASRLQMFVDLFEEFEVLYAAPRRQMVRFKNLTEEELRNKYSEYSTAIISALGRILIAYDKIELLGDYEKSVVTVLGIIVEEISKVCGRFGIPVSASQSSDYLAEVSPDEKVLNVVVQCMTLLGISVKPEIMKYIATPLLTEKVFQGQQALITANSETEN